MAGGRYSDKDRAVVKALLDAHDGNVKRAARESGVPEQTVRDWKHKWEREGLPAVVQEALPAAIEEFTNDARRVRNKALTKLEGEIDRGEVKAKDLIITVGVLTDKIRVSEGKPTSQVEHSGAAGNLPVEQVRELFAGLAKGMLEAAHQRATTISSAIDGEEPIIDAEFEEQAPLALPASVSD